jgi:hypothetical protein
MGEAVRFVPLCFDGPRQYHAWERLAQETRAHCDAPVTYCTDCTPEYQQRMLAAGRCKHPETEFARNADGVIEGRR